MSRTIFNSHLGVEVKIKQNRGELGMILLLIWKNRCSTAIASFVVIGTSISEDDNCTSHCYGKNLTCSTELTTLLVEKNSNCTNSSKTAWSKDYHPSYNIISHSCEGYKQINNEKACDKVNISRNNLRRICYCLRPSKSFVISYLLHLLIK